MIKLILNPYAGRGKAQAHIEALKTELDRLDVTYQLVVTEKPGQGIDETRKAKAEGVETVVAVGGDSTVSEVINGLIQTTSDQQAGTLGIIPLGTANDLADMLQIPRNLGVACQKIVAGQTRLIDVGLVNGRYFGNNSAVGLEPMVTIEAEKIERISGAIRYLLAALRTILKNRHWQASLHWDQGSYYGPVALVSVGNSPRTGGSFWMTPRALLDDGLLDVIFTPSLSRPALLRLLPMTFTGNHINHPAVTNIRTTSLKITMDPTPLQADGEIIDRAATEITYSILPQKLRVVV